MGYGHGSSRQDIPAVGIDATYTSYLPLNALVYRLNHDHIR